MKLTTTLGALLLTICHVGTASATPHSPAGNSESTVTAATALRHSERLAQIRRHGTLIVGLKTDYPPFGTVNSAGQPVGFEHDLAEDFARRLGVGLSKVTVSSVNRLQKLADGSVDLIIATQGDTAERRKIATQIEPDYYASGVTLFSPPDSTVREWQDVRGKKVCVVHGAYFNREMSRRYLFEPMLFNTARDAKLAVRDKRCVGFLYDNTALLSDFLKPEWAGYKTLLPVALVTPWAIAIAREEAGSDFEALAVDTVIDWHRTGFLIEREKAWQLPPSKFLLETQRKWTQKTPEGDYFCRRLGDTRLNPECRNPVFLAATEMSGLRKTANLIEGVTGLNITLIHDAYDRAAFFSGLAMTLLLTTLCIAGSLAVGVVLALAASCRLRPVRVLTRVAAVFGRMTPPLLQIYLVVFGIGSVLSAHGLSLSPLVAVVGCLSLYTGSSIMVFILEAAALKRPGQAADTTRLAMFAGLIPHIAPPVVSALVNVAKATMMSSAVAIPELLSATTSIISEHGNVATMMNILLISFVALIFVVVRTLTAFERLLLKHLPRGQSAP